MMPNYGAIVARLAQSLCGLFLVCCVNYMIRRTFKLFFISNKSLNRLKFNEINLVCLGFVIW